MEQPPLGGGVSQIFFGIFTPTYLGKMNPIWLAHIFQMELVQPPTSIFTYIWLAFNRNLWFSCRVNISNLKPPTSPAIFVGFHEALHLYVIPATLWKFRTAEPRSPAEQKWANKWSFLIWMISSHIFRDSKMGVVWESHYIYIYI